MKEKRECPYCGKKFEPMTEKEWAHNLRMHLMCSARHGFGTKDVGGSSGE